MFRWISGLLAAAFLSVSFAQDDAVIITATRFVDVKRHLPVGVTVITSDDIRSSATSNLPEILSQFGLLHIRDNAGTPNQQIDLRGFGITGDQNTLVLLDGVRLTENELVPAQLTSIPLDSIHRIEIVRGSGAVVYGGGATGGTVNIITRRVPPGTTRGYGLARFGGYGTREVRAGLGRMGEALGFGVDFSHEDTDGYRANNRFRQTNVSATAQARGADARAYLRLSASDQALGLPGALTEAQIAADRRQAANPHDSSERNDAALALGGTWSLGRHELAADAAYRDKAASAFFRQFFFFVDTRAKVKSLSPRAKLRFDALGREHDVTVGFDWENIDYDNVSAASPATVNAPFSRRVGEQTHHALYGQANAWIADSTRLILGARGQRSDERLTEEVFPPDQRRQVHDLEAYEAALRHGLGGGWWTYAKYGRSFRLATFDENACFFPPCAPVLLEPQTAKSGEAGVEYDRRRWRARAAVYEMRLQNEIYFSPLAGANINLAPTRRRGFEFEGAWRAAPGLELHAGLALLEARFRSGIYGGVDVTGNAVPLVPEAIASAGLHWRFAERSRLNVNARYVGRQRFDNDQANTFPRQQPSYTLLDLKLEHRIERLELGFELRNAFNQKYFSYGVVNFLGTSFSAYPAPERAAYISVAYRLD
jgi:iron complex outermembrane recepter protein